MTGSSRCAVAVDIGGTFIKAAVVYQDGSHAAPLRVPTDAEKGPDDVLARALALADSACEASRASDVRPVALGVAVPGRVDEASGTVVASGNLGWRNVGVRAALQAATELPVHVGHDVRCGAIAEQLAGAAQQASNFLFVPVGTGIGAAVVIDGKLHVGATNSAGEIGHIVVNSDGEPCGCGQVGCLETVASCAAIARRYSAMTGTTGTDSEAIAAAARQGDRIAQLVLGDAVKSLATVLAGCVAIVDPELIVIGGGLASAGDEIMRPLAEALAIRLMPHEAPSLRGTMLGELAGCTGVGLAALHATAGLGRDGQHEG